MSTLEFGLDTFMPVTDDGHGQAVRGDQVVRDTIEEAVLAEAVGIDSFNIGEHYRPEFMDSANHVVLAAIAGQTRADPSRHRGDRAEHAGPRAGLHRLRHARCGLQRPRAADRRARLG